MVGRDEGTPADFAGFVAARSRSLLRTACPPGAERNIEVRVASGRPDGLEFGLVVFEERP